MAGFADASLIILPGGGDTAVTSIWPALVIVFGCFCWSVDIIHSRNTQPALDLMTFTALQMFCGGLMLLVPAWLQGDVARWSWDTQGLLAMAYMISATSGVAYTAFAWLSVNATPAHLATYSFVSPVVALLLGWWMLDERLGSLPILGAAVILFETVLVNWLRASLNNGKREAPPVA